MGTQCPDILAGLWIGLYLKKRDNPDYPRNPKCRDSPPLIVRPNQMTHDTVMVWMWISQCAT